MVGFIAGLTHTLAVVAVVQVALVQLAEVIMHPKVEMELKIVF